MLHEPNGMNRRAGKTIVLCRLAAPSRRLAFPKTDLRWISPDSFDVIPPNRESLKHASFTPYSVSFKLVSINAGPSE